jgi:hypothetical protein
VYHLGVGRCALQSRSDSLGALFVRGHEYDIAGLKRVGQGSRRRADRYQRALFVTTDRLALALDIDAHIPPCATETAISEGSFASTGVQPWPPRVRSGGRRRRGRDLIARR